MKPSIGRIVHVFLNGRWEAGIITRVHSDTCINATVFPDNKGVDLRTSLLPSEKESELSWRWPPKV